MKEFVIAPIAVPSIAFGMLPALILKEIGPGSTNPRNSGGVCESPSAVQFVVAWGFPLPGTGWTNTHNFLPAPTVTPVTGWTVMIGGPCGDPASGAELVAAKIANKRINPTSRLRARALWVIPFVPPLVVRKCEKSPFGRTGLDRSSPGGEAKDNEAIALGHAARSQLASDLVGRSPERAC